MTSNVIELLASGSRVAIIRLRALGDCVLSTPAIHLLKQHRPDLEIAVVADERLADIFRGNPDISSILIPSVRALRSFRPDVCVNFHGGGRSVRLSLLSRAPVRAAYDSLRFQWAYNTHIPRAQHILEDERPVHTAEHMASAMFWLGVPRAEVPQARLYPEAGRSAAAPAGPYAVLHPFASHPDKTWPPTSFVELAKRIKTTLDLESVLVGGNDDDLSPFAGWPVVAGAPLLELARLVRDAELFIGNDSGPAHLAAAFMIPEVVLFGPSNAQTWSPWRTTAEVLQADGPIGSIPVDRVLRAATQVLAKTRYDLHSTQ